MQASCNNGVIMKAEFLLSEEFTSFSKRIAELHESKKEQEAEFKRLYAEHKAKIKSIDEEALSLKQEFDDWVASQNQPKS